MPDLPPLIWAPGACIAAATVLGLAAGRFVDAARERWPRLLENEWWSGVAEAVGDTDALDHLAVERRALGTLRAKCPICGRPARGRWWVPGSRSSGFGGRCTGCGDRLAVRFPVIELASAILSGLVAWRFGCGAAAAGALLFTWALLALSAIDLETHLLPDPIVLPLLWLGLLMNLRGAFAPLPDAVLGAVAGYLLLRAVSYGYRRLTAREGMGRGDCKLLAVLGAWLGWQALPLVVLLSSAAGALAGLGLLAAGRRRDAPLPFGPCLAGAGWISLMWGEHLLGAGLRWGT